MLTVLYLLPTVLSMLVLGAHLLRLSVPLGAAVIFVAGLLGLLAVPRRWAARVVQVVLVLGALEWLRTLLALVETRQQTGQPYVRLVVILGVVIAVSLAAALLFETPRLRRRFARKESQA